MARRKPEPERQGMETFRGILWLPWVFIFIMIIFLVGTLNYVTGGIRTARLCKENLRRLYMSLELHEFDQGQLPRAAFYPESPELDEDSLCVVLQRFGLRDEDFVCPNSPEKVRESGLSYLWNRNLNSRTLHAGEQPEWMMIEIHALSDKVPGPHFGKYHILYTDGRIEHTDQIPPGIRSR